MLVVLRLGHRKQRDARISTHCGLVARAFGADKIIFSGEEDSQLIERINDVTKRWGNSFSAMHEKNWRNVIKKYKRMKFIITHLTMYGIPIKKKIKELRKKKNLLVIIGGEKVPGEVFSLSDYNIAITNQPHSEVAALAIFLYEYFRDKEKTFKKAKIKIIPQERGKKVVEH